MTSHFNNGTNSPNFMWRIKFYQKNLYEIWNLSYKDDRPVKVKLPPKGHDYHIYIDYLEFEQAFFTSSI